MKRYLTIFVTIVILVTAGTLLAKRLKSGAKKDENQYKVAQAQIGTVQKTISATGTVQPWTTVDIKSKAGGRVNALYVDVGSEVKTGQILARIDPSDTLLTVNTAQADIDSAEDKTAQDGVIYRLQEQQTQISIANARAALASAIANQNAAAARLATAQGQSQAQPSLTNASIQQAQANYDSAVQDRQQLNSTQAQDRATAQAAYDQAVATEKNAGLNVTRQQSLEDRGFVAQSVVDQAVANDDVAKAQVASALEKLNTIHAQQQAVIESANAKVAQANAALANAKTGWVDVRTKQLAVSEDKAALGQARAQVNQAKTALDQAIANAANNSVRKYDIAQAQAEIARAKATMVNAKTTLDQTIVRAPSDGVILVKDVEQGTYIASGISLNSSGTTLMTMGDVTRMYIDVSVDETDIANVDEGQSVDVSMDAYPNIPFEGKVIRIDPQAVVLQNVTYVHVRVELDNSQPTFRLIKPGMNATCEFVLDKKDSVVMVPNEAIHTDDNGSYVELGAGGRPAPPDPKTGEAADPSLLVGVKVTKKRVQIGLEGNDNTEVTSGLQAGQTVVTETIEPTPQQSGSPFGGFGRGGGGRGGGGGGGRGR